MMPDHGTEPLSLKEKIVMWLFNTRQNTCDCGEKLVVEIKRKKLLMDSASVLIAIACITILWALLR